MARKSNLNTTLNDVKFHSVSIIPKDKPAISISALWNVINLHESIFRPVITGNIQINDTVNLRATYQFSGDEQLYISFSKPSSDQSKTAKYSKIFRITSITDGKQSGTGSGATYVLHFCSEELLISSNKKIERIFDGGRLTDYVKSICTVDLGIPERQLNLAAWEETTSPPQKYLIRDKSPFEAIEFFERLSVNEIGSPFLFFENFLGHNFVSLSRMFDGTSIIPGGLIVSTARNSEEGATYVPVRFNEILNFRIEKINDILDQSQKIAKAGVLDTFDIFTGKLSTYEYDVSKINKSNLTNKESDAPQTKAPRGQYNKNYAVSIEDRNNIPWRTTSFATSRLNAADLITPYEVETGNREMNSNESNYMLQRQSMMNLLEYTSITGCEVAGNPAFTVGSPIDITFPAFTKNEISKRNIDPYLSGRYLITKVRHNLTKSTGLRTFIALASNSPLHPTS